MNRDLVVYLTGTTASGKKAVARELAPKIGAECLSMDAVKVFRGMNIGAAQSDHPLSMHLVDLVPPSFVFSTGRYVESALAKVNELRTRGVRPMFVGGTGLYLRALVRGFFDGPEASPEIRDRLHALASQHGVPHLHHKLKEVDPETASRVGENDSHRLVRALEVFELTGTPISVLREQTTRPAIEGDRILLGLRWDRDDLEARIMARVDRMYEGGLLEECARLLEGPALSREAARAIGYREGIACVRGEISREDAKARTVISTRQFARRQRMWFRQFPEIQWIDSKVGDTPEGLANRALGWIKGFERSG